MLRFLFLVPVVLCLLWLGYLNKNGWTVRQGKKGFVYILSFSGCIAAFYTLMLFITSR